MTHYTMNLILDAWIRPHIDIEKWQFYDLSCKARDDTNDKVLHDAVAAGKALCSIFKEPTITPSSLQVKVHHTISHHTTAHKLYEATLQLMMILDCSITMHN